METTFQCQCLELKICWELQRSKKALISVMNIHCNEEWTDNRANLSVFMENMSAVRGKETIGLIGRTPILEGAARIRTIEASNCVHCGGRLLRAFFPVSTPSLFCVRRERKTRGIRPIEPLSLRKCAVYLEQRLAGERSKVAGFDQKS